MDEGEIDAKHYLGKKGFEFVTNPKNKGRARVNSNIIRTQKANQQFNWNGDFIFEDIDTIKNPEILKRAYVELNKLAPKGNIVGFKLNLDLTSVDGTTIL